MSFNRGNTIISSFVYKWTDNVTGKLYIGSHKGTIDDGYICSGKLMLEEYINRPNDFTRQILIIGEYNFIREMEVKLLESVDASKNPLYYNRSNGRKSWYVKQHTKETRQKMQNSHKGRQYCLGRILSEKTKNKISLKNKGKVVSEDTKQKMRLNHANFKGENNPMYGTKRYHSEETKQKMKDSHQKRKHL